MLAKKIARKLSAVVDKVRRDLEAVSIGLTASYDTVKAPPVDPAFREHLWSEDSPFAILLGRNTRALEDARKMLAGKLRVFTSQVDLQSEDFSWHMDHHSGKDYPKIPHTRIVIAANEGHDIVVPWELSRLQFVPTLIQAHRLDGNRHYADFFRRIVDHWIAENPCFVGTNWVTAMDVALRAINLALGLLYFGDHLADRLEVYSKVLWSHAEYIYKNDVRRSRSPKNNHFLVSMVGLLAVSLCFRASRADRFFRVSTERLTREILRQFRPDGGNFESAIHYHQLSLEAVLVGVCLLSVADRGDSTDARRYHLPKEAEDRIEKACTLVSDYLSTFHGSPQFGDSSDTRVLMYKDYFGWDPRDHLFLKEFAAEALPGHGPFCDGVTNHVYEASGYGFFANDLYGVCLNASPAGEPGQPGRGHDHCDKGSLVLQVGGVPVLIDAGTYCYTPDVEARFSFRRTASHNVVMIDGLEQADVRPESVFSPLEGIEPGISFRDDPDGPTWVMAHNGYCRCQNIGRVSRTVRCLRRKVEIEEEVEGKGTHVIDLLWHLHPDIRLQVGDKSLHLSSPGEARCVLAVPAGFDVHTENSSYSAAYGSKTPNAVVRFSRRVGLPFGCRYDITLEGG